MSWFEELGGADFGDVRLSDRLVTRWWSNCARDRRQVFWRPAGRRAARPAYRFWGNQAVTPEAILRPHVEQAARRAADHATVLAIQHKTYIEPTIHPGTNGPLYLMRRNSRGLVMQSLLLTSEDGLPLGVLAEQIWTRPKEQRGKRRITPAAADQAQGESAVVGARESITVALSPFAPRKQRYFRGAKGDTY